MTQPDRPESAAWSIVVPVFNEAENIEYMISRITDAVDGVLSSFEIVVVNDGSTDGSGELLERLRVSNERLRPIHFSRNFGHMAALSAGLEHARGTRGVITLDADGQHPPELIPTMVEQWTEGADIVQTIRETTESGSAMKEHLSRAFYALMDRLAGLGLPSGAADFRLLDRQVVDIVNRFPESNRFLRGLIFSIGFKVSMIPYRAEARHAGTTKYNLRKMMAFGLAGITSFSTKPLRISIFLGALTLLCALLYGTYVAVALYRGDSSIVPGWSSLIAVILFFSSVQLICLGLLSEYMGRLYMEAKQRPRYIVRTPPTNREP